MNEIIDNLKRKIKIKKPSTLDRVSFFRAIGSDDCSNPMILAELSNAMWIESIDDKPMPKKQMADIEYIIQELEKSNANDLISDYRLDLYKNNKKSENGDIEVIKK